MQNSICVNTVIPAPSGQSKVPSCWIWENKDIGKTVVACFLHFGGWQHGSPSQFIFLLDPAREFKWTNLELRLQNN